MVKIKSENNNFNRPKNKNGWSKTDKKVKQVETNRKFGRPKMRWEDDMSNDLNEMKARNLKEAEGRGRR